MPLPMIFNLDAVRYEFIRNLKHFFITFKQLCSEMCFLSGFAFKNYFCEKKKTRFLHKQG